MIFNKSQIKNNFARAISSYDQNAILQKMVSSRLVDIAKNDILDARKIIDLGSGTGFIANKILDKFPNKEIFQLDISEKMLANNAFKNAKIVADIEFLPFKKSSFDLAISSLSFQWLNDLERTIPQILETLKNRQKLHFSILGSSSLKELRGVIKDCKIELSVNKFIDEKNLKSIINEYEYTLHKEDILLNYQDCHALLKSMKKIGANYSSINKSGKNNLNKNKLEVLNDFYLKNFNIKDNIYATWQVFYVSIKSL